MQKKLSKKIRYCNYRCLMNPRKGATPVPGPIMMTGTWRSLGSRKKRFVRKNIGI